jgi:hypothetical protein
MIAAFAVAIVIFLLLGGLMILNETDDLNGYVPPRDNPPAERVRAVGCHRR